MKRNRQISLKECYSILNLSKGATLDDVKRAYRRRAFELHPDLHPGNADAARQFQRLNEAYVALAQILHTEASSASPEEAPREEPSQEEKPPEEPTPKESPRPEASVHSEAGAQRTRAASAAYAQEDVLREL